MRLFSSSTLSHIKYCWRRSKHYIVEIRVPLSNISKYFITMLALKCFGITLRTLGPFTHVSYWKYTIHFIPLYVAYILSIMQGWLSEFCDFSFPLRGRLIIYIFPLSSISSCSLVLMTRHRIFKSSVLLFVTTQKPNMSWWSLSWN